MPSAATARARPHREHDNMATARIEGIRRAFDAFAGIPANRGVQAEQDAFAWAVKNLFT